MIAICSVITYSFYFVVLYLHFLRSVNGQKLLLTKEQGTKKSVPGANVLVCEQVVEVTKIPQVVEVCVSIPGPEKF